MYYDNLIHWESLMRFIPTVYLPSIASLACALLATAAPAEAWDAEKCLSQSDAAHFRDMLAPLFFDEEWQSNNRDWRDQIHEWMKSCSDALDKKEEEHLARCLARVEAYDTNLEAPGLGLNMNNDDFHSKFGTTNLAIPDCLKDEELFTKLQATNLSDATSVNNTVMRIVQRCTGSIVVPYVSATIESIDNPGDGRDNRGRLVVWIGDNDISHYVQFTVSANPASKPSDVQRVQASVVNVKLSGPDKGTYIFDWTRSPPDKFDYNKQFGNDQHCYSCHWTGVLAIYPFQPDPTADVGRAADTLGPDYGKWLKNLNKNYASAATDMNDQINKKDKSNWVKVAGAPTLDQFPDVLSTPNCSTPTQKTAIEKLAATGCNLCHRTRGQVYEFANYEQMIRKYVSGGFMPPKLPLSSEWIVTGSTKASRDDIRKYGTSAYQCFVNSAAQQAADWAKNTDCQ